MRFVNNRHDNRHESSPSGVEADWYTRSDSGSVHASSHEPISHGVNAWSAARTTTSRPSTRTTINQPTLRSNLGRVFLNSAGQRVDIPSDLNYDKDLVNYLKDREQRFCNAHHLRRDCCQASCPYDHDTEMTDGEFEALQWLARSQRCPQASDCTSARCTRGHLCPNGKSCPFGNRCKFADLHGIDTVVAEEVMD